MLSSLSVILPCSGNCQIKWQRRTLRIPQFSNLFNDSFRMLALCTILYLLRFLTMLSARIIRKQATEMGTIHSYLAASLVQVGSGQESFDVCQRSPRSTVHFGNLLCLQLHTAGSHILRTWKVLVRARAHTHTHTHTHLYIYIYVTWCNTILYHFFLKWGFSIYYVYYEVNFRTLTTCDVFSALTAMWLSNSPVSKLDFRNF